MQGQGSSKLRICTDLASVCLSPLRVDVDGLNYSDLQIFCHSVETDRCSVEDSLKMQKSIRQS